ncbi:MAG: MFS transporter [Pirellulales bacterium]|nr:MFS transporter [Pirellulales bacterium]
MDQPTAVLNGPARLPLTDRQLPPSAARRRDLSAMLGEGFTYSLMVGLGEQYLAAFALAIGLGQVVAGLIASVPMLIGALLQLVSPLAIAKMKSYRRWVVLCAVAQAVGFVPLVIAAWAGRIPAALLFLIAGAYWGTNMACGAAWNTWAATLVPLGERASFFSRRTRLTQGGLLVGFVAGGLTLQAGAEYEKSLIAFAFVFLAAAICRFISAAFLFSQNEPSPPDAAHRMVPPREMLRRFRTGSGGRLLIYFVLMQAAAQISGPYFTPFMLKQLHFSYATYMMVVAAALVAKMAALPTLGRMAHRFGARRLLIFGGCTVIPMPVLWLASDGAAWLSGAQLLSGIVWAAYELATLLLFLEQLRDGERTSVLTTFNLAHAAATVGGAALGGLLLGQLGKTHTAYLTVFALSGIARLLTLPLLRRATDLERWPDVRLAPDPVPATIALPTMMKEQIAPNRVAA